MPDRSSSSAIFTTVLPSLTPPGHVTRRTTSAAQDAAGPFGPNGWTCSRDNCPDQLVAQRASRSASQTKRAVCATWTLNRRGMSGDCPRRAARPVAGLCSERRRLPRALPAGCHRSTRSMGRTGTCYVNAVAESFFATFKKELIHTKPWPTMKRLREETFLWIEGYYNNRRRHSGSSDLMGMVD